MIRSLTPSAASSRAAKLMLAGAGCLALLTIAPARARAETTGGLEGSVIEQPTGAVVPGSKISVAVRCGSVRRTAAVEATGQFRFAQLPGGACTLTTSGAAYVTSTIYVNVIAGAISTVLVTVTSRARASTLRPHPRGLRRPIGGVGAARADVLQEEGEAMRAPVPEPRPRRAQPAPPPPPMAAPPKDAREPRNERVARGAPVAAAKPKSPPAPAAAAAKRDVAAVADVAQPIVIAGRVARPVQLKDMDKQDLARGDEVDDEWFGRQQPSFAVVRVFPVPQYTRAYEGPRTDFRETIYWNPTVETDAGGDAEVAFVTSDAVTAFRATAEGFSAAGVAGGGHTTFQSKLPLTLDVHLPVAVTAGDTVRLPVTLSNETDEPLDASLDATFGAAFRIAARPASALRVPARGKLSVTFPLEVVATDGDADVMLKATARGLSDELKRTIRVVPRGFPVELSASGTARRGPAARHTLELGAPLAGTIHATVTMYTSPVAAIAQGMEGMIREPGGCFEQTSSTNYPNIMILGYLGSTDAADPALVQKTQGVLDRGYKLLTGYESPQKGYEWFGQNPGHEALTAYGLMEFADMAKVYDVDAKMVERTADWLMSRRDQKGGFLRSAQALDSFGRASPATTNAYIMWALAEAKRAAALGPELAAQRALGSETTDPYLLALAANTQLAAAPRAPEGGAMIRRLTAMQAKDGSFPGAKETITMSGGESLTIETTSLAVLALLKASENREYEAQIRAGVDWLNTKRGGHGAWGNTQATVLGLKALTAYSEHARQMAAPGTATLVVNGKDAGTLTFDKGRREALVWSDFAAKLVPGTNTIEVRLDSAAQLPYSIAIDYRTAQPPSSPRAKIAVATQLLKTSAKMGDGVTLRAHVENKTSAGVPMTLARIGIPGGLVFQTWQLKELRDKGLIDFYETRPREVIVYWRALPPNAKKDLDLNLLAQVPGRYEAPASAAYLYYTAEDKAWTAPVAVAIE